MFKYTKHNLKKLEELFKEIEYTVRYERGNFQSGYCIVEHRKIAVINKFFDAEARINSLLEILGSIEVDPENLQEKTAAFYKKIADLIPEKEKNVKVGEDSMAVETTTTDVATTDQTDAVAEEATAETSDATTEEVTDSRSAEDADAVPVVTTEEEPSTVAKSEEEH